MDTIGQRYQRQEQIGHGAMGIVYAGRDEQMGTAVAIKELKPELIGGNSELVARFRREGEALRQLNHPNIVKMWDAVEENGRFYLILEYIEGGNLQEMLTRQGALPIGRALTLALDLADALTRAHRLGIIHRDLKPANVLIAADGTPRLTDFGVARLGWDSDLTQTGAIVGTVAYLCPEACLGHSLDERADIWSFGVLLYEMLTGKRPFQGEHPVATLHAILHDPIPDLLAVLPEAGEALNDLLYRMLVKERNGRIPSIRLVAAELEQILQSHQQGTPTPTGQNTPTAPRISPHTPLSQIAPTPHAVPHNLPQQTTPFVGRQAELAELSRLMGETAVRLITILAPGGMGKSRLSLEYGLAQAKDPTAAWGGIYLVSLAPLANPEAIVTAVAEAIGFQFIGPHDLQGQLLTHLQPKKLLLIMDNFEHLLGGSGLVQAILQAAPEVKLMATSRERLNLTGETVLTIGGMEFPDWETPADALTYSAVQLFLQSAQRVRVDFDLQAADLRYIARICRMVEGMPLAILLSAAWVDTLAPAEIAEEMSQSLDFLESDLRDLPERQRSMRGVFGYSWQLLTAEEQAAFARLSVFRGGFSRTAAQSVGQTNLRLLTKLVNKSLVGRDAATGRFALHELLRQFGAEQLQAMGEEAAVRRTHSDYYLRALAQRQDTIQGPDQVAVKADIEQDFENVRAAWLAAVENGDAELINLARITLDVFLYSRSRLQEGYVLFTLAMKTFTAETTPWLFYRLQSSFFFANAHGPAEIEQGLAWAREHGTPPDLISWLISAFYLHIERQRNPERAIAVMEEALALARATGELVLECYALHNLGYSYTFLGEIEQAKQYTQASLEIARRTGNVQRIAISLGNLGWVEFAHYANYAKARAMLTETVAIYRQLSTPHLIIYYLMDLGWLALDLGEQEEAERIAAELQALAKDVQNPGIQNTARFLPILLNVAAENWSAVQQALAKADETAQNITMQLNIRLLRVIVNRLLGVAYEQLPADLDYILRNNQQVVPDTVVTLWVVLALAAEKAAVGEEEAAVQMLSFITHHRLAHTPTALFSRLTATWVAKLQERMPTAPFTAAWAHGRTLTAADVLNFRERQEIVIGA